MKSKGFTLIELLGVIIILSLIMLIAIPNITSTLDRSKKEQYLVDARKFVSLVEYELRSGNMDKPNVDNILKITLGYLQTNDIKSDPENKEYDLNKSYVIVARKDKLLKYYVNLVTTEGKGIKLVDSDKLTDDPNTDTGNTTQAENKYNLIKNNIQELQDSEIKTEIGVSSTVRIDKYPIDG